MRWLRSALRSWYVCPTEPAMFTHAVPSRLQRCHCRVITGGGPARQVPSWAVRMRRLIGAPVIVGRTLFSGGTPGRMAADATLSAPAPSALVARTLQVYSLALVKDVTTIGEEPPLLP